METNKVQDILSILVPQFVRLNLDKGFNYDKLLHFKIC